MDNVTAFSFTLIGIELVEIRGVKAGALITLSLSNLLYRVQYYETHSNVKSFYIRTFKFNGKYTHVYPTNSLIYRRFILNCNKTKHQYDDYFVSLF